MCLTSSVANCIYGLIQLKYEIPKKKRGKSSKKEIFVDNFSVMIFIDVCLISTGCCLHSADGVHIHGCLCAVPCLWGSNAGSGENHVQSGHTNR